MQTSNPNEKNIAWMDFWIDFPTVNEDYNDVKNKQCPTNNPIKAQLDNQVTVIISLRFGSSWLTMQVNFGDLIRLSYTWRRSKTFQ